MMESEQRVEARNLVQDLALEGHEPAFIYEVLCEGDLDHLVSHPEIDQLIREVRLTRWKRYWQDSSYDRLVRVFAVVTGILALVCLSFGIAPVRCGFLIACCGLLFTSPFLATEEVA